VLCCAWPRLLHRRATAERGPRRRRGLSKNGDTVVDEMMGRGTQARRGRVDQFGPSLRGIWFLPSGTGRRGGCTPRRGVSSAVHHPFTLKVPSRVCTKRLPFGSNAVATKTDVGFREFKTRKVVVRLPFLRLPSSVK